MSAGVYDIVIDQGGLFEMILLIQSDVDTPMDLTGYDFEGQVRKSISGTLAATFEFDLLDQSDPDTMGQVRAFIAADDTALINIKNKTAGDRTAIDHLYDISYITPSLDKVRLLQGIASVSPEVTR